MRHYVKGQTITRELVIEYGRAVLICDYKARINEKPAMRFIDYEIAGKPNEPFIELLERVREKYEEPDIASDGTHCIWAVQSINRNTKTERLTITADDFLEAARKSQKT